MRNQLDNPNRVKAWNLTQLAYELHKDLALCQTESERVNCRAIYTKEMRELRDEKISKGESFTNGEMAVMEDFRLTPLTITPFEITQF